MMRFALVGGVLLLGCGERAVPPPAAAAPAPPTATVTVAPEPAARPAAPPSAQDASTTSPAAEPSAPATPAAEPTTPASPAAEPTPPPGPPRWCDAKQKNTPCIYLDEGRCLLRLANCSGRPCSVAVPKEVACPPGPPRLPPDACDRLAACGRVSDEGCCIGCNHPMRTRIPTACARKIESSTACAEIERLRAACVR